MSKNDAGRRAKTMLAGLVPLALLLAAFGLAVGLGGCGDSEPKKKAPPPRYDFKFKVDVTDTDAEPIPAVPVKLGGKTIGYTDRSGKFEGTVHERPGTEVTLELGEIDGYQPLEKSSVTETLEVKPGLSGNGKQPVPVLLHSVVKSTQQPYLVWVKATCDEETLEQENCAGLQVLRDGDPVAVTDRLGRAHFSFEDEGQTRLRLTIDTPAPDDEKDIPRMEPADPLYEVELNSDPEVYLVEQTFENPDERNKRPRWRPPARTGGSSGGSSSGGSSGGSGGSSGGSGGGSGGSGGSGGGSDVIDLF